MDKRVIKCGSCDYVFITKKALLNNSDFTAESSRLDNELKKFDGFKSQLENDIIKSIKQLKKTKMEIRHIKNDIKNIEPSVQCAGCGKRIYGKELRLKT